MSSTTYRIGFIGAGRPWKSEGATGFGMAYQHADGYVATGQCTLTACADLSAENAQAFAEKYGIPRTYSDYHKMLAEENLDIVSICTWPHLHAPDDHRRRKGRCQGHSLRKTDGLDLG